jgi:hypothetical protein
MPTIEIDGSATHEEISGSGPLGGVPRGNRGQAHANALLERFYVVSGGHIPFFPRSATVFPPIVR